MVRLFGDKALKDISNPHLFRLKEKMLQYKFTIRYLPGKHNAAADFLSKYPGARTDPDKVDEEQNTIAAATVASLDLSEHATLNEELVKQVAVEDPSYQLLVESVTNSDWGSYRAQELACLRPFYCVKNRLAVAGGLVTYTFGQGCVRLVIPEALRGQIAANLHASHQGLDSMLRRARQAIYWPGIEGDLQYHRASCNSCNANAPSQLPEPLLLTPPLEFPFQQTVANLQFGAKRILQDNKGAGGNLDTDKMSFALLQYLNTPLRGVNKSPAKMTIGKQLRDGIPTARVNYKIDPQWRQTLNKRELQMPGSSVWIEHQATKAWSKSGTMVEVRPYRQYTVRIDGSGRITLRNPSHLKEASPLDPLSSPAQQMSPELPPMRPCRQRSRPGWLNDYVSQ
ncbi:hypothetical protein C7M84_017609 [Penaeus vannamei]|uniref:RNA-directed DNA polymerase n=1 Tax=Penaeus vannamei TaxID=6689 RepID=A0A423SJW5_PENVA|nr:hypothetical protein C7M84_017609 [Penaeus vannamei]